MFGWFFQNKEESIEAKAPPKSWFERLKQGLKKTQQALLAPFSRLLSGSALNESLLLELKKAMLQADLGPYLTKELLNLVKSTPHEAVISTLKDYLKNLCCEADFTSIDSIQVFMMVGVNGAGKTTTTAKLGVLFRERSPLLIAADTYRAAAVEQLKYWAESYQLDFFTTPTTDPAAVAFQGIEFAQKHNHQLSFVDTSGRLHTNKNLMQELAKIKRVLLKKIPAPALKTLLILDGSQGQNMLEQTKIFHQDLGVDGLIVTKIDGSSKAGALFEIMRTHKLPIYFLGCGESIEALRPFHTQEFIDALFGDL